MYFHTVESDQMASSEASLSGSTVLSRIQQDKGSQKNVACGYDLVMTYNIRKFSTDAILYGETQCSKKDI